MFPDTARPPPVVTTAHSGRRAHHQLSSSREHRYLHLHLPISTSPTTALYPVLAHTPLLRHSLLRPPLHPPGQSKATMATRIAVFLALALVPAALAQAPSPTAAPAGPPNVTAVLEKGGQYTSFIRLMKSTQQDTQLNSQLNNSFNGNGYTVFAPTDNAFSSLKPGTLNSLTQQDQVALVQGHILPQFYTWESFETASNPVRTQASGRDGPFTLNVTANTQNQLNVSTGVVDVTVNNALSQVKPLAVYSVDKVLLPFELFGAKAPAAAPTPSKGHKKGGSSEAASGPAGTDDSTDQSSGAVSARAVGWSVAGLAAVLSYLL